MSTSTLNRKVCVATGSRADYGFLRWLMESVNQSPTLNLQVLATGMHLEAWQGMTIDEIVADGFGVDAAVEVFAGSDSAVETAEALSRAVGGVAVALMELQPDVVVILGDRVEALATAIAAHSIGIPIAHIHGGELSGGALDDAYRHSITKLAYLHFPCTAAYRRRIIQMGESPLRVHNVGALAVESVHKTPIMSESVLVDELRLNLRDAILFTYHPVTLEPDAGLAALKASLLAMDEFPETPILITHPNSDAGGAAIARVLTTYAASRPERVQIVPSLGQQRFVNCLRLVKAVVGNSSSTLYEAAIIGVPGVDIGPRQRGRFRPSTVEHCEPSTPCVAAAIRRAIGRKLGGDVANISEFGDGTTSSRIARILAEQPMNRWMTKDFYDIDEGQ